MTKPLRECTRVERVEFYLNEAWQLMWSIPSEPYGEESPVTRKQALLAAQEIRGQYRIQRERIKNSCGVLGELLPGANDTLPCLLGGEPMNSWQRQFFIPQAMNARTVQYALEVAAHRSPSCAGDALEYKRRLRDSKLEHPQYTSYEGIRVLDEVIEFLRIYLPAEGQTIPPTVADNRSVGDKPDANGLVATPADPAAYEAASKVIAANSELVPDTKELNRILTKHPEIRRWKPSQQRLCVHRGDWAKYIEGRMATADDELADNPEEVRQRAAAIRARNNRK